MPNKFDIYAGRIMVQFENRPRWASVHPDWVAIAHRYTPNQHTQPTHPLGAQKQSRTHRRCNVGYCDCQRHRNDWRYGDTACANLVRRRQVWTHRNGTNRTCQQQPRCKSAKGYRSARLWRCRRSHASTWNRFARALHPRTTQGISGIVCHKVL